jgi:uncharacterized protein YeaO (DUF488 family)
MVKTARIGDTIKGIKIDITVKNNPRHILSPTWDLVIDFKRNKIQWAEYEQKYKLLISRRLKMRKKEFDELMNLAKRTDIVLTCFCKDERFCHRRLAKEIIEHEINQKEEEE